jgi:hypothetical protein
MHVCCCAAAAATAGFVVVVVLCCLLAIFAVFLLVLAAAPPHCWPCFHGYMNSMADCQQELQRTNSASTYHRHNNIQHY